MSSRTLLVGLALSLTASTLAAQSEHAAFIARLGDDTVAVDRYAVDGSSLTGTLILRSPATQVARYRAELGADGTITRFQVEWSAPAPGTATPDDALMEAGADSATGTYTATAGERTVRRMALPPGTVPLASTVYSMALYEWGLRHAGTRSGEASWLGLDRRRLSTVQLAPRGRDSVAIPYFAGTFVARLDDHGRILGLTGEESTAKIRVVRVADADVKALAADFAARDAAGRGLGTMSPRDTTHATLGGADLLVDYGRPSARGRTIWGGVVPWGEVWRTGANAATQFSTTKDLLVAGQAVPAGTYTLFTLPGRDATYLIVNRQTGQWGTQYDAGRDLVRIPLTAEKLGQPVERFTIGVAPSGGGGTLSLSWGDTRYSAMITVP